MNDIWGEEFLAIANFSMEASEEELLMARLYGEKSVHEDGEGNHVICHRYKGKLYMTGYDGPLVNALRGDPRWREDNR